jgi:hypothetical protein
MGCRCDDGDGWSDWVPCSRRIGKERVVTKITDNRTTLLVEQVEDLWEKVEALDRTNYPNWYYVDDLLICHINRRLHKRFPFNRLKREDFKVELLKDGKHAEVYVYCRGALHEEYDKEYLEKLGALLEKNNFEVTAYLLEDCYDSSPVQ